MIQSQFDNLKNLQATQNQNKNPNYKLRWDVKRRDYYVNQIKYELTRGSAESLYTSTVIKTAAKEVGLLKDMNKVNPSNKPWFDGDCSRARKVA
jgi:hypothetical protein